MAYIRPRDTALGRRYDVVWREAGRNRSRSFTRERDAKTYRLETERRLRLGLLYDAPAQTLEEAYDAYIGRYEVGRAPSTLERRKQAWPALRPLTGAVSRRPERSSPEASSRRYVACTPWRMGCGGLREICGMGAWPNG